MQTLSELTERMAHDRAARAFSKWCRHVGRGDFSPEQDPDLERFVKATVAAGTTGNDSALRQASRAWVQILERRTVLGQLPGTTPAPPFARVPFPMDEPEGDFVGEASPAPVVRLNLTGPQTEVHKIQFLEGFTKELIRSTDDRAVSLIERQSLRGLRLSEDRLFLSDDAAVEMERPAGALRGVVSVGVSSPVSVEDDLEALWVSVRDGDPDAPAFVTSSRGALWLSTQRSDSGPLFPGVTLTGGNLLGVPLIISRAAANKLVLIDGSCVVVVDEGLTVESSEIAAVEMADGPSAPAQLTSAFQVGAAFLRFVRYLSWKITRGDAVAFMELPISGSPA